jgi:predicted ribosomally synthesized peptide with nif11-like leader
MSETAARDFISRVESDETFAGELDALRDDPQAVLDRVHTEGFDATAAEIRAVFLDRFGDQLSPEQLEVVAAGGENWDWGLFAGVAAGGLTVPALAFGGLCAVAMAAS